MYYGFIYKIARNIPIQRRIVCRKLAITREFGSRKKPKLKYDGKITDIVFRYSAKSQRSLSDAIFDAKRVEEILRSENQSPPLTNRDAGELPFHIKATAQSDQKSSRQNDRCEPAPETN
jgi:hypothetical protein